MVRFNPKARLDTSRVNDGGSGGRGRGGGSVGGGGMRFPIPTGRGGIGGIILLVVVFVVGRMLGIDFGVGGGASPVYSPTRLSDADDSGRYDDCKTGADANESQDCLRVAVENSLTDFWSDQGIRNWEPISALTTFTGGVSTGCGSATTDVGPFYCPADFGIYEDTTFFDEVFERQLGGPDGGFVEAYVIAHEYGHHISNLLGFMDKVTNQKTGPQSLSTRLELQADCYAGLWAQHATETEDASGEVLVEELTDKDIQLALEAAAAVGDDHIQEKTQGQTNPETWNHGSSEQRMNWFREGFEGGTVESCDTFSARTV
ncbi:peptidase [Nocardioides sp. Root190]|uniref:KPN_02809 family neutral zinc metallopeptidase n=1 Tax=Nocardioides sp. Root190 TaxID=1736488 RepID=UPI0006F3C467|nr:neutral zinc metallopeptidase [Nocardioides sp. Root190]KRB74198.1 peptidase [Nocardioides sp. Root190]